MKRVVFLYIAVISLVTYHLYSYDKRNAEFNGPSKVLQRPRIPEKTLHMLSLAGGWPGALFAQQTLRHKTIKQPFQRVFWCTVVANVMAMVILLKGVLY